MSSNSYPSRRRAAPTRMTYDEVAVILRRLYVGGYAPEVEWMISKAGASTLPDVSAANLPALLRMAVVYEWAIVSTCGSLGRVVG